MGPAPPVLQRSFDNLPSVCRSRDFDRSSIRLNVQSEVLARALDVLDTVGHEAVGLLPELLEPWQVISTTEAAGPCTEVTVLAKGAFGRAAMLRLRLIALIYERLQAAGRPALNSPVRLTQFGDLTSHSLQFIVILWWYDHRVESFGFATVAEATDRHDPNVIALCQLQ